MALPLYLAMTAAEMSGCDELPQKAAWMACHFSAYGTALTNFPARLPRGSMLILNDRMPPQGHDPKRIAEQLRQAAQELEVAAVLLDLQRPGNAETAAIARSIIDTLPCPVGITECYAETFSCPVFLGPPPLHQPLRTYLAPWSGREVWLEAALDSEVITVTPEGSRFAPAPYPEEPAPCHTDEALHCQYHIAVTDTKASFTLFRTAQQLSALLQEAETLGVTRSVGLYQQLHGTQNI